MQNIAAPKIPEGDKVDFDVSWYFYSKMYIELRF